MNSPQIIILKFLKRFLSLCVVFTMLLLTVVSATVIYTMSEHTHELMLLDHHEESEKEEQQEDDSKDEKIEMQILSSGDERFSYVSEHITYKPLDGASDYILEIPFPPPERV